MGTMIVQAARNEIPPSTSLTATKNENKGRISGAQSQMVRQ